MLYYNVLVRFSVFFFKQKSAYEMRISDWSSDVCSSDLGVDGNPAALQIAENQFKRIVIADLNLEPKPVAALPPISVFKSDPNWIFDSFLNPQIGRASCRGRVCQYV